MKTVTIAFNIYKINIATYKRRCWNNINIKILLSKLLSDILYFTLKLFTIKSPLFLETIASSSQGGISVSFLMTLNPCVVVHVNHVISQPKKLYIYGKDKWAVLKPILSFKPLNVLAFHVLRDNQLFEIMGKLVLLYRNVCVSEIHKACYSCLSCNDSDSKPAQSPIFWSFFHINLSLIS